MTVPQASLAFHPLHASLYEEMHSRPFQVIASPSNLVHIAVMSEGHQEAQFKHWQTLFSALGERPPNSDQPCSEYQFGSLKVRREKHLEFTSLTFIETRATASDGLFGLTPLAHLPHGWLAQLPGKIVCALQLAVQPESVEQPLPLPQIKGYFEEMRLVGSRPQQGDAQVWTSFRLHSDGLARILICNRQMSDSQLGRLTQRLLEIETYRLMALLALPQARLCAPSLVRMDRQLARLTQQLASGGRIDEKALLGQLTDMAAKVEDYRAKTTFRFAATQAYHELVLKRLDELREDEVSGHLTLREFITRRLTPAVHTCRSLGQRLEDLSRRIDRVSDMMRTRVELSIQGQNQQLLTSMNRRSKIQLMMQHTVEGLSVAAISYYAISLIKLIMDAIYDGGVHFSKPIALGISVPLVLVSVWLFTRRIHKRFKALAGHVPGEAQEEHR